MKDELNAIMEIFAKLNHGDQVDLFLNIKDALLKNRQIRLEEHKCRMAEQDENIKALYNGNEMITGNSTLAAKQG